ncbi:MAG: Uma2 family endonuclease [Treponema sp.]|jgi:Uma2 family endonuclease|nr:Uma2 family endonuclease [Treponema sp.]
MSTVLAEKRGSITNISDGSHTVGAVTDHAVATRRYTYATFPWEQLRDGTYAELIDGEVMFFNAPGQKHQQISMQLSIQIGTFLKGKVGKVYAAPFDVSLFPKDDGSDETIVMPDMSVILDMAKLQDDRYCKGAPDWIIEIASPSTRSHDNVAKFNQYLKAGVREYWIVSPEDQTLQVHILDGARYVSSAYDGDDTVPVSVLPGCAISLPDVFAA